METLNALVEVDRSLGDEVPVEVKALSSLLVQSSIFNYDIVSEWNALVISRPQGFAAQVSLRGAVLRSWEFNVALDSHLIPKARQTAISLNTSFDAMRLKHKRGALKEGLALVASWHTVRNFAAGHYSKDYERQVNALLSLNVQSVLDGSQAVAAYGNEFSKAVREVLSTCAARIGIKIKPDLHL